ncbi:MAG TPA: energy transducer TonB [Alloacidobacterium sp.]|nr:energy transducer TonB [Alloacidobacterium sp.]
MRRVLQALALIVVSSALTHARGQVMQNTDYERELLHAKSLLAGATSTDVPHHIHYDLKLYDEDGRESTATFDVYRDPILYQRVEIKAGDYQLTLISNLRDHVDWQHYTGNKPLKIADFEEAIDLPQAAVRRFSEELKDIGPMRVLQLAGAPLLCANDNDGTTICFNPMIRLFAYAQMFNRTIVYDRWLPVGSHSVPGAIRIYEGKRLLVEATGTAEVVKKFPSGFMEIPGTPSQPAPDSEFKIVKSKTINQSQERYGNIEVAASVDEKGRVTKESIVDSDDKHLDGFARKFVRGLVFEPKVENGQPVPFETVLYIRNYPF